MQRQHDVSGLFSILVPVYNERAYLRRCIERVLAAPLPEGLEREIVLVNDASTDGTDELVDRLAADHPGVIRAFHQETNQGKGAAIRRAIQEMRGQYAVFQDADLEYDPDEYTRLLEPLLDGLADVVYGSRFAASPCRKVLNYHHTLGNLFLTHLSNWCTGLHLTDMETCYKAFRADVLKTIPLRSNRFGIEPEITAKIAKRGLTVYEVPISYHGRSYMEGKKIGWKDGVSAIYRILKYWLIDDCYEQTFSHLQMSSPTAGLQHSRWATQLFRRFLGSRIVEIHPGIGHFSRLLPKREQLVLIEPHPEQAAMLREIYRDNDLVTVYEQDAADALPESCLASADTVLCLNTLERVEDDVQVISNMSHLLAPGGRLILMVPQWPGLFGACDTALGIRHRYDRGALRVLLNEVGLTPIWSRAFDAPALCLWWLQSRIRGKSGIGRILLKLLDFSVHFSKRIERWIPLPGISLLMVAEKPRNT